MTKESTVGASISGRRVRQLADDIGVNPHTVYRAIKAGSLRAAKIGKALVITDEAARSWLSACTISKTEARA